eukprot:527817-Pleurochrysis_carterae.AAC.2
MRRRLNDEAGHSMTHNGQSNSGLCHPTGIALGKNTSIKEQKSVLPGDVYQTAQLVRKIASKLGFTWSVSSLAEAFKGVNEVGPSDDASAEIDMAFKDAGATCDGSAKKRNRKGSDDAARA